jgi:outer membrane receptor protein involved in Fe transport
MNCPSLFHRPFLAAGLAISLLLLSTAFSQTAAPRKAPPPATPAPATSPRPAADNEEVIELSPFIVEAPRDDSYGALNSNSITSFNVPLEKLPMSADIFTSAFMDDTNSTTLENMLRTYSAGVGTGSAAGDVGGIPVNQPLDRGGGDSVSAGVQLRGLGAAVVKQDGFMLPSPAGTGLNSNFGVERVEVINGPQSLLYGNGGGGGVVNTISKQARFGKSASGLAKFSIDEYGHWLGQVDLGTGSRNIAVVVSLLKQELGDNRDWIGGPLEGVYTQIAARVWDKTVIRLTGKQTEFDRFSQQGLTLNATNTTIDARHGQNLRYLLATNQLEASASGASGAGVIGNGHINWDNVDSYGGNLREEWAQARLGSLTAETEWTPWLSTQISAGYQNKESRLGFGSGANFFSPNASTNPLPGEWTISAGGSSSSAYSSQPSRSKSFRFSALLTNQLFRGRARSQTIIGADYTEGHYANENYSYYEADANFNPVLTSAGARIRWGTPPEPFFSVTNGPVKYPFVPVGTQHLTYKGKNYVAMIMNLTDPALISPTNPQGVTAGDLYIHARGISRGLYAVNFTDWGDGRLSTLAGARYVSAQNLQFASTAIPPIEAKGNNLSYSFGANYAIRPWLRGYATVSDSYNLPGVLLTVVADPIGKAAPISHAIGEEVGVKVGDEAGRFSGSFAVFAVQATKDPYAIPTQLRDSINPAGLNGRYLGATGSVISVDRKSQGVQIALTARPTRGWRTRLSAAFTDGTIGTSTEYKTLYNDQFYANSAGQVTYANGTVVFVPATTTSTNPAPVTPGTAGAVPLTISMLSNPADLYYANPDPITGLLGTGSRGRNVLNNTTAAAVLANGPIKTGVSGVPISQYQLTGVTPVPTIVTSRAGEKTTGYPQFSVNLTNLYTVQSGRAKGFKFGGTVSAQWRRADYYYYPNGYSPVATRQLFMRPTQVLVDLIVGYEKKLKGVTLSTQVNVNNVLDDYKILIRPNNVAGFSGINNALWSNQPREVTWTTTLKF